jgi:hypothetical protein
MTGPGDEVAASWDAVYPGRIALAALRRGSGRSYALAVSQPPPPDETPSADGRRGIGAWLTLPPDVRRDLVEVLWLFVTLRVVLGALAFLLWYTNSLPGPCHFELALDGWTAFPPLDNQGWAFPLVGVWERWDGCWYANIAANGYVVDNSVSFWPLFPSLMSLTGQILGGDMALGGLVVNAFAYTLGMMGLLRLVRLDFGSRIASRTVLFISVFPAAFFFFAPFTEAIFLACAVWAIYGARRHLWLVAGVAALLAGFSRTQGILLVLPLGWEAVRYWWAVGRGSDGEAGQTTEGRVGRSPWLRGSRFVRPSTALLRRLTADVRTWRLPGWQPLLAPPVAAALPAIAFVTFVWWAGQATGQTPLESQNLWGGANFHAPWETIQAAWDWAQAHHDPMELINDITLVVFLVATVVGLFRLPLTYSLYAIPQVLIVAVRIQPTPLTSTTRLMLVIFPVFVLLALLGRDRRFERGWLLLSVVLLAYFVSLFVKGDFVA